MTTLFAGKETNINEEIDNLKQNGFSCWKTIGIKDKFGKEFCDVIQVINGDFVFTFFVNYRYGAIADSVGNARRFANRSTAYGTPILRNLIGRGMAFDYEVDELSKTAWTQNLISKFVEKIAHAIGFKGVDFRDKNAQFDMRDINRERICKREDILKLQSNTKSTDEIRRKMCENKGVFIVYNKTTNELAVYHYIYQNYEYYTFVFNGNIKDIITNFNQSETSDRYNKYEVLFTDTSAALNMRHKHSTKQNILSKLMQKFPIPIQFLEQHLPHPQLQPQTQTQHYYPESHGPYPHNPLTTVPLNQQQQYYTNGHSDAGKHQELYKISVTPGAQSLLRKQIPPTRLILPPPPIPPIPPIPPTRLILPPPPNLNSPVRGGRGSFSKSTNRKYKKNKKTRRSRR